MKKLGLLAAGLLAIAAMFGAAACGDDDEDRAADSGGVSEIVIEGAWARNSPGGMMGGDATPSGMAGDRGAAYMTITNNGDGDDALIGASSDVADATEVHESVMDGDQATMKQVDRVEIAAGASVELKPGGYHVMFIGLKEPLMTGDTISVELEFENAGKITVEVAVRES